MDALDARKLFYTRIRRIRGMQASLRRQRIIPVRIPPELGVKLDAAISKLHYPSRSAFIREAIEQHVKDTMGGKVVEVRDVSVKDAAMMIAKYLGKNPGAHYVSDMAEELGLELSVAFRAAKLLETSGRVRGKP